MKPEKALELVHRYSELQWAIRACKSHIAMHLDSCKGLDSKRLERRKSCEVDPWQYVGEIDSGENEKQTHLREWYRPDFEHGDGWYKGYIDVEMVADECIHCYAAHMQIQKRKELRKQFGFVKAAMTRTTPKPTVLAKR